MEAADSPYQVRVIDRALGILDLLIFLKHTRLTTQVHLN
jgi:hypothetical protein